MIRTIVHQDDEHFYHVTVEEYHIKDSNEPTTVRNDIHGKMDSSAYIAWLSNALFNASWRCADPVTKKWLMA